MGLDDVLRALSDPTRREVVRLLVRRGPLTAGELADHFDLAKSTMSGHFNVLRQAGLVVAERHGTRVVYSAHVSVAEEALSSVMGVLGIGERPTERAEEQGGEAEGGTVGSTRDE